MIRRMVTHLVQCTNNGVIESAKEGNELVSRRNVAHEQSITSLCKIETRSKSVLTWNAILKDFMSYSSQFSTYREEFISVPRPLIDIRWQKIKNRAVLAPLMLKQNAANIIAGNLDMSRKRKSEVNVWTPPSKRIKLSSSHDEIQQVKTCKILLRKISAKSLILQYKCTSKKAVVKLFNVLKEIPQEKQIEKPIVQNDFMSCLSLQTKETTNLKVAADLKYSHPVKLASHTSIPFSSDYGRKLITREHHFLPQDVVLRKIERIEWYLKHNTAIKNDLKPEIMPSKRVKHFHDYEFPKRQFWKKHQSLKGAFLNYIIKPCCVRLEKANLIKIRDTLYKHNLKATEDCANCSEHDLISNSVSTFNVNAVVTISSEAIGVGDSVMCTENDLEYQSNSNELDRKLISDSGTNDGNHTNVRRSLRFCHVKA